MRSSFTGKLSVIPLFFFCLFNFISVFGQSYFFDIYTATEDAPSKINCLLQDKDHYLWLAGVDGVSRFDGDHFESFTSEQGLAPQAVRAIFQDSRGTIWFGHEGGGITKYQDNVFSQFHQLDSLIHGNITSVFEDGSSQIWITTVNSGAFILLDPFDKASSKYLHFLGKSRLSDQVFSYCLGQDGSIYLITDAGIKKYQASKHSFDIYHPNGLTKYFSVICMFEDRQQNQWFGTHNGGLYKYEPIHDTVLIYDVRDGLSSNWIWVINEDRLGNIWVGTEGGGATRINQQGLKIFNKQNGLPAKNIYAIVEDSEGNIHIGSSNNGLSVFKGDMFDHFGAGEGLLNLEINAIVQDQNKKYWLGTNNGISSLFDEGRVSVLTNTQLEMDMLLPGTEVRFLKRDKQNRIWIGTSDRRVVLFNPDTKFFDLSLEVNLWFSDLDNHVSAMEIDALNRLWVGTREGLLVYNIDSASTVRFSNENGLIGNNISAIYADKDNTLWVGAINKKGVSSINSKNQINTYSFSGAYTPSCFVRDKAGKLWIGTRGHGLLIMEDDLITDRLGVGDGLLSNGISTLDLDENGRVYIGTNSGLNVFSPQSRKIHTYGKKNGFVGIETNQSASYIDNAGNIWFGTNKGLTRLRSSDFKPVETEQPNLLISSVKVNQVEQDFLEGLRLSHSQDHIRISYKSICLTNPESVRYRTWLHGQDTSWQEITTQTEITYPALSPGKYVFKVIARNSSGVWNNEPIKLKFQILKPFYLRWYVVLSFLLFVFVLFRLYIRMREKNLIKEKQILALKVEERTLALKNTYDELAARNKDITDSIKYALRIQLSILPPQIPFENVFVLFKPKDIVSGDFYWMATIGNKEIIAAVDCTGHGVPGAFMSFIGYSSLNEVVKEKGITQPSEILNRLNIEVIRALNLQDVNAINDGMDMAIVSYDNKTHELDYAGAYNPLYINNGELREIKADRFAIGKTIGTEKCFSNHRIKLKPGDTIYIFSDGYADQFGGEKYKKFKTGALKKLLLNIQDKTMDEQKIILENTIEDWRGDTEQIDDILFIGRRF